MATQKRKEVLAGGADVALGKVLMVNALPHPDPASQGLPGWRSKGRQEWGVPTSVMPKATVPSCHTCHSCNCVHFGQEVGEV